MKINIPFFITSSIFWFYIRFTALTSRIKWINREVPENFRKQSAPYILAFWHNRQFFLCYSEMNTNLSVIMSASKDGEYIARIARMFAVDSIRGSSSKGGGKALRQMLTTIKSGKCVGITPDGPRGPIYSVQPGIILLARKTGVPIIPVSCNALRKKVFKSWDKYQIPYPCNSIVIAYGNPFYINAETDNESARKLVEDKLNETTRLTDNYFQKN